MHAPDCVFVKFNTRVKSGHHCLSINNTSYSYQYHLVLNALLQFSIPIQCVQQGSLPTMMELNVKNVHREALRGSQVTIRVNPAPTDSTQCKLELYRRPIAVGDVSLHQKGILS